MDSERTVSEEAGAAAVQAPAPKKKRIGAVKKRNLLFIWLGLGWSVLHFVVFWLYVNIGTIVSAFQLEDMLGNTTFAGWDNFLNVFQTIAGKNETALMTHYAYTNTLWLLLIGIGVNIPVTLVFSYMIFRRCKAQRIFRVVLYLPAIISPIVLCLVFQGLIDSRTGILAEFLRLIGAGDAIPSGGILGSEDTAWTAILVFSVWTGISGNLIYFISAMSRVPDSLIESAQLDGASEMCIFLRIVMPLVWSTVTTIVIQVISTTFSWYLPSMQLTGGGPNGVTSTIGLIIISNTSTTTGTTYGYVAALSVLVGVIGTAFILGVKWLMERLWREVEY